MLLKKYKHPQFLFFGCCLIFSLLLAACGTNPTTGPGTAGGAGQTAQQHQHCQHRPDRYPNK